MCEVTDFGGEKYDQGKLRYDLLPILPIEEIVKVFTLGANKYGDHNWEKGIQYNRLYAASCRHIAEFIKGQPYDKEMGTHHIANAIVNLLMILSFELDERHELDNLTKVRAPD